MHLSIICAVDKEGGFGFKGGLPWSFPQELKWFREVTKGHTVVMGRATWDSLPPHVKPLKGRQNIVMSSSETLDLPEGVIRLDSFDKLRSLDSIHRDDKVFVIGGRRAIHDAFHCGFMKDAYITLIDGVFDCDVSLPSLLPLLHLPSREIIKEGDFVNCQTGKSYHLTMHRIPIWSHKVNTADEAVKSLKKD